MGSQEAWELALSNSDKFAHTAGRGLEILRESSQGAGDGLVATSFLASL